MAFAVRKWPDSNDPRPTTFCVAGYQWGAMAPYKWIISTSGALAPFDILNSGVVLPVTSFGQDVYLATGSPTWPGDPQFVLNIQGWTEAQPLPSPHSLEFTFTCVAPGVNIQTALMLHLFPYAIQVFDLGTPVPTAGAPYFVSSVFITPCKWDTPETP